MSIDEDLHRLEGQLSQVHLDLFRELIEDDRDLALITLSNAPRYFDWFSDEIKADPYIDAFKNAVARYIGN